MSDQQGSTYGTRPFSEERRDEIKHLLNRPLASADIKTRRGPGGTRLTYISGDTAINMANLVFGFDGWKSTILKQEILLKQVQPKIMVVTQATVRVELQNGAAHEDVGFGIGEGRCIAQAVQKSCKEAVTDARKRALRVFGRGLGNCLYEKEYLTKARSGQIERESVLADNGTSFLAMKQEERVSVKPEPSSAANVSSANQIHRREEKKAAVPMPTNAWGKRSRSDVTPVMAANDRCKRIMTNSPSMATPLQSRISPTIPGSANTPHALQSTERHVSTPEVGNRSSSAIARSTPSSVKGPRVRPPRVYSAAATKKS